MGKFHDLLGVAPGATDKEIDRAFKKLAKSCHPDLFPGDVEKEKQFKEYSAARDGLKAGLSGDDLNEEANRYAHHNFYGVDPREYMRQTMRNAHVMMNETEFDMDAINVLIRVQVRISKMVSGGKESISYNIPNLMTGNYSFHTREIELPKNTPVGFEIVLDHSAAPKEIPQKGHLVIQIHPMKEGPFEPMGLNGDIVGNMRVDTFDALLGFERTVRFPSGESRLMTFPPGLSQNRVIVIPQEGLSHMNGRKGNFHIRVHVTQPRFNEEQRTILKEAIEKIRSIDASVDETKS